MSLTDNIREAIKTVQTLDGINDLSFIVSLEDPLNPLVSFQGEAIKTTNLAEAQQLADLFNAALRAAVTSLQTSYETKLQTIVEKKV